MRVKHTATLNKMKLRGFSDVMSECAQSDPISMDKPTSNNTLAQKPINRDMFYTRTSKIRRRVKSKWADLREKLEAELAASLEDITATDVKNLKKNILNLMKRHSGSIVETESCESDGQDTGR